MAKFPGRGRFRPLVPSPASWRLMERGNSVASAADSRRSPASRSLVWAPSTSPGFSSAAFRPGGAAFAKFPSTSWRRDRRADQRQDRLAGCAPDRPDLEKTRRHLRRKSRVGPRAGSSLKSSGRSDRAVFDLNASAVAQAFHALMHDVAMRLGVSFSARAREEFPMTNWTTTFRLYCERNSGAVIPSR